jgi:hypothetical protein
LPVDRQAIAKRLADVLENAEFFRVERPGRGPAIMASTNKCLARNNKSGTGGQSD